MKIGIEVDWQRRHFDINRERIELADRLGYDMVFTAGDGNTSEPLTPLGYVVAATKRIGVGTRVVENIARSPAATAMAFQTLRHMAGPDREIIAGIGNAMPYMAESWHGVEWTPAYWRMRDFVTIMKQAFRGEAIQHDGRVIKIPFHKPGEPPRFDPLAPILETDPNIRIIFGGGTELMIRNAAEIADGLLPNGSWSPGMMKVYGPLIEAGFAKRATPIKLEDFPIWAHVDVLVTDDIPGTMAEFKEYTARWCGGYGGEGGLYTHMAWRGYKDAADRVVELYQDGRIAEAEAAVPDEYIDECWLIGPLPRILQRWKDLWIDDGCNLIVRTDNWPSAEPADNTVYEPLIRALHG